MMVYFGGNHWWSSSRDGPECDVICAPGVSLSGQQSRVAINKDVVRLVPVIGAHLLCLLGLGFLFCFCFATILVFAALVIGVMCSQYHQRAYLINRDYALESQSITHTLTQPLTL